MNLAAVALKRGQWKDALELLARSQELVEQTGAQDLLPEVYRYIAEANLGLNQIEQAASWAAQSLHIAREHETKLEEGATRRVLGQIHHAYGDLQTAERELRASLALLETLNSQYQVAQTLYQLACLHADAGREDLARQEKDRAIAVFERLGAQLDLERAQNR
jgi:tetratricopeptide (TPR) repeat protein